MLELLDECELCNSIEAHEERRNHEANATEGVIDVETPSPRGMLGQDSSHERPDDTSTRPRTEHQGEVLGSLSERHNITEDSLRQCDDATTTNALDDSPTEHPGEILRRCT